MTMTSSQTLGEYNTARGATPDGLHDAADYFAVAGVGSDMAKVHAVKDFSGRTDAGHFRSVCGRADLRFYSRSFADQLTFMQCQRCLSIIASAP
jgi:hypothetical protein